MDISTKKRKSLLDIATSEPEKPAEPPKQEFVQTKGLYSNSQFTLRTEAEEECYLPYGRAYAESMGWAVTLVLADALKLRASGAKVLSIREADTAARGKIALNDPIIEQSLVCSPTKPQSQLPLSEMQIHLVEGTENLSLITEDVTAGLPDDIYQLRSMWNRGISFYNSGKYSSATAEQKQRADEAMDKIRKCFEICKIPPWPEEDFTRTSKGFHQVLCRPEWMSVEQYDEARQRGAAFVATMRKRA